MSTTSPARVNGVTRLLHAVCCLLERVAIFMLLATTFFVVLQVVARNVFQKGMPWAEELARYGGLGIVFLAIPLLLLYDKHISVDILSGCLRGKAARLLRLINELIVLLFCGLFLYGGYAFLLRAGRFTTPALGMPNLLFYLPTMVGVVMFAAVSVLRLCRALADQPAACAPADYKGSTSAP